VLFRDKRTNGNKVFISFICIFIKKTNRLFFFSDAIAGIFIRDIAEGSVCARDERLLIGDQIIEVNDQSLNGFSNVQALYLLQNTSSSVRLKVRRYLDGIKYDKIKEMIGKKKKKEFCIC
jgi:C-terminal processing protease CtpA/Prc